MTDYQRIINLFYGTADSELKTLLLSHSRAVADKALRGCDAHPELSLDREFVEAAAMLHDIGIIRCDAPGIHCHGTEPYIRHGLMGARMLMDLDDGLLLEKEAFARVCQRHTGAGITREEVAAQQLPMPLPSGTDEPYMPESMEEMLVCYADKFFSKSRPEQEKTFEQACRSLAKFGDGGVERFTAWHRLFG